MPYFKKHNVVILGFDGVLGSALVGALDLFSFTGVSWQRFNNLEVAPRFNVQIASLHKQEIRCSNRLIVQPHIDLLKVKHSDIILIPTIGDSVDKVLDQNKNLIPHIIRFYKQGCDIASNCSGAFLLATTGLLNNKVATTHWGYAEKFKSMYPQVNLKAEQLVTQDENLFCAAGGSAFYDLSLLLIERYCGRDIASEVAKTQVIDMRKRVQSNYAHVKMHKKHHDTLVKKIQEYMEENHAQNLTISAVASHFNVIPRTLNRRFQSSLQVRPIQYLQQVRIEHAKRLLEQGETNIKSLASEVGYEDQSSFNRLFKKITQLTPREYREKSYNTR